MIGQLLGCRRLVIAVLRSEAASLTSPSSPAEVVTLPATIQEFSREAVPFLSALQLRRGKAEASAHG